jgi:hypothetical protein
VKRRRRSIRKRNQQRIAGHARRLRPRKAAGFVGGILRFVTASKHFGRTLGDACRLTNQFSPDLLVKPICALEGRTGVINNALGRCYDYQECRDPVGDQVSPR